MWDNRDGTVQSALLRMIIFEVVTAHQVKTETKLWTISDMMISVNAASPFFSFH